ncbi:MAG: pimeloyl-ACP methyl ester carboxylesterase [Cognaticolwellia sp.]|jgi:pimeloyl-ACP methyl ester carboxylesterase
MTLSHRAGRWIDRLPLIGNAGPSLAPRLWSSRPSIEALSTAAGRCRMLRAPGQGPRLLFAVDGPNVLEHYDGLLAAGAGRADIVVIEPPGTGGSRPSSHFDYSCPAFVDWTREVLAATGPRVLVFPCYLGFVAQWAAHAQPTMIEGLALAQTPSWPDMERWLERVDRRSLLRTPILGQLATRATRNRSVSGWYRASASPNQVSRLVEPATTCLAHGGSFCLASLVQGFFETGPPPQGLTMPKWLGWGELDRSHRHSVPEQAMDSAKVVRFPDAGHSPELEHPEIFLNALLQFLEA